jgi:hypothetical protein
MERNAVLDVAAAPGLRASDTLRWHGRSARAHTHGRPISALPSWRSDAEVRSSIGQLFYSCLAGAMCTAEILTTRFHAMADDRGFAVVAAWRKCLDRALERIEDVRCSADLDLKSLVVQVSAALAFFRPHAATRCKHRTARAAAKLSRAHGTGDTCHSEWHPRRSHPEATRPRTLSPASRWGCGTRDAAIPRPRGPRLL